MNKIILIGIPNCGKTTLGRRTADIMRLPFFDTDIMVKDMLNIENPADIMRLCFNRSFLTAQYKAVAELTKLADPAIIATGAEVALMPECTDLLQNMGTIIYIKRDPELVLTDLKNSEKKGLVMRDVTNGTEINMQEEAVKLYAKECHQYEALANLTLENNGSEDEGVNKLVTLISSCITS